MRRYLLAAITAVFLFASAIGSPIALAGGNGNSGSGNNGTGNNGTGNNGSGQQQQQQAGQNDGKGVVAYDSIPAPLPGNIVSVGPEAYAFKELGDQVALATNQRLLTNVSVTMSSWGCQSGHWYDNTCASAPGATFSVPITFNIYAVGAGNTVGALLASKTDTFAIPYRPSYDSVKCSGTGEWFNAASSTCFNGKAVNISFKFTPQHVVLPNNVIYGIAYNSSHYGPAPIGEAAACYTSSGGCAYDSLNIGLAQVAPTVGTDVFPDGAYQNSPLASMYCPGDTGPLSTFRLDNGCWAPYSPAVQIRATKLSNWQE
jgi:hypothetical protein